MGIRISQEEFKFVAHKVSATKVEKNTQASIYDNTSLKSCSKNDDVPSLDSRRSLAAGI